ncbi:dynamin family protein [Leclercia adecarboxylata]|uniref:dynamin family protein n=1 Tax=Leclercia adecarboxylata TaxID=83655 RepID=UPI002DBC5C2E|nr:dynamin family protein [Leclercia adecarboxylata]MEC3905137.1 dynamin family protein [Leclercia adecarboxylata]
MMTKPLQINQSVYTDLQTLSHFWCFKRKPVASAISQVLSDFESQVNEQISDLTLGHQERLALLETEHSDQITDLTHRHQQAQEAQKRSLTARIDDLEAQHTEQASRNAQLTEQVASLNECVIEAEALLSKNSANMQVLQELKQELDTTHQQLQQDYTQLHHDNLTLNERFTLVQSILAASPAYNPGLDTFRTLLDEDYAEFAAEESSLANEAGALLALQKIASELEQANAFPPASGKTLIGVAGGFSSGKSEFINSFIKDSSIRLATGMNPVTVIPSFVVCAPYSRICGYAHNGGSVTLSNKIYKALSHDYVAAFGFDLRSIMPTISLQAPMDESLCENICLIDTPGYNPGKGNQAEASDRETTVKFLEPCSAMIWVIGLDPAGTISQTDIEFIRQLPFQGEDLYLILNKADVKSQEDTEAIMETVSDELTLAGIHCAGMTAYSSTRKRHYATSGLTFDDFLASKNKRHNITSSYTDKIASVFNLYDKALKDDLERVQQLRVKIKDLQLRTLKESGSSGLKEINHVTDFLSQQLGNEKLLAKLIAQSKQLNAAFSAAARQVISVIQQGEAVQ